MPAASAARPPRPLAEASLRGVQGVLTDIDDTLTADGALAPEAREALQRLAEAEVPVFAVTGRPLGWSRPAASSWPLQAVVAENGAVALWRPAAGEAGASNYPDALHVAYAQDEATRSHNAERLRAVLARVLSEVPGARAATDSAGRVTDIAIDHAEHAHLDAAQIAQVVALMREAGMTATVSSIHVNGWFGTHDKLSGARWIVRERLGRDLDAEIDRWVYVGDSTNDQVMFGHFPHSVGVANLMDFADRLHTWPAWLASAPRGRGFAEVAMKVLAARQR